MGLLDRFSGPPSKDKFAKLAMDRIRRVGENRKLLYDREQFLLRVDGEDSPVFFMGNAYAEYCAAPRESREEVVQRFVRGWFVSLKGIPDNFDDLHPDLLPVVRCRSYYDLTQLAAELQSDANAEWPYHILGEHFGVGLVYDMRDGMRYIVQEDLDRWGVTLYEALEAARGNLSQTEKAFIGPEKGEGLYLSANRDNYDASRLILLDLIRKFNVKGDPIAMIPNRDTLLVAGADDPDALAVLGHQNRHCSLLVEYLLLIWCVVVVIAVLGIMVVALVIGGLSRDEGKGPVRFQHLQAGLLG